MAQRDKKQEEPTELRAPESTSCANGCGFPGNPGTHNLCPSCILASPSFSSPSSSPSSLLVAAKSPVVVDRPRQALVELDCPAADRAPEAEVKAPARTTSPVNRCSCCRKRVGLAGFRCRCGQMFCGEHRYSDRHGCRYDYKAAERDAIARDNPAVRAAKIVRL